jgi:SAM-dependent methyltransferase
MDEPVDFWEQRYASSERVWSGRVNQTLVDVLAERELTGVTPTAPAAATGPNTPPTLPAPTAATAHTGPTVPASATPGRALDLGCGEGGDAIWLAQHGWRATGLDISPSAIARARAAADTLGLGADSIRFEVSDLEALGDLPDAERYDLVTACFLQSPVALSREQILRRAAERVSPGGRLLIISHAAPPPWSGLAHRHAEGMPQPADDLAALDLAPELWDVELAEVRQRDAVGPDGQHAVLDDGVVLVRRR